MTVRRVRRAPPPSAPRAVRRRARPVRRPAAPREEILDAVSGPFERRIAARQERRS
jgi:hypothetical protein